jgi:hypothetical protein
LRQAAFVLPSYAAQTPAKPTTKISGINILKARTSSLEITSSSTCTMYLKGIGNI